MSKEPITIPYNFTPRRYQLKILSELDKGIKRAVWCVHRRGGKDVTILNWVIKELVRETKTCFYIFPSYAQGKKAIWDAINSDGFRIIDHAPPEVVAQKNSQEMKIRFNNGSLFQIVGSDNISSLMGTNPKIIVFSEYALQSPEAWNYLRPILRVNGGVAIFIGTPRGKNHFWELFRMAKGNPEWFCELLTIHDTKVLTEKDLDQERAEGMSEELIAQEYLCSFERGVDGSYYAPILLKMQGQGRICEFFHDEYKLVHTSWDLGWDDATAIIFFQIDSAGTIRIIDYEEHSQKRLVDYKAILDSKPYKYGTHLFPHDVKAVDGLSTGVTRKEILEDLGIQVTAVPKNFVIDGIQKVRALLSSQVFINSAKCQGLLKALESYHKDWDDKNKIYSSKPTHNWASHGADSCRYLAEGLHLIESTHRPLSEDIKAVNFYFG